MVYTDRGVASYDLLLHCTVSLSKRPMGTTTTTSIQIIVYIPTNKNGTLTSQEINKHDKFFTNY